MRGPLLLLSLSSLLALVYSIAMSPPEITEPSSATKHYIPEGDPAVFKCQATGKQPPYYKWLKNGVEVKREKNFDGGEIRFDSKSGDLTITEYSRMFDGEYTCLATIQGVTSMSQPQTLIQTTLGAFRISSDTPDTQGNATEYSYAMLKCENKGRIQVAAQDLSYNWFKSKNSKQLDTDGGRRFFDKEGNVHFTYVLKKDQTNEKLKYMCGYSSVTLKVTKMGHNHVFNVKEVLNPTGVKPIAMYVTKNVIGRIGASARLECMFSGYDPLSENHLPIIRWFTSSKEILASDKYIFESMNRALTIHNLKEEDEGIYFCQAHNGVGTSEKSEIYLNVTSPPVWKYPPRTQTMTEKKTAVFNCSARSMSNEVEPDPPEWYFNGELAHNLRDHNRYVFSDDKKTLTIKSLKKPEDIVCVQCKVTNSVGSTMGQGCLNVLEPIVLTEKPAAVQKINKGDVIQLSVEAVTDEFIKELKYEWTFKNREYVIPASLPLAAYNSSDNTMTIDTANLTQEDYENTAGAYACRVYHLFDSVSFTTEVKLMDTLGPIELAERPPEVQEISKGDVIDLTVVAADSPHIEKFFYQWEFKGKTYSNPVNLPHADEDLDTGTVFINTSALTQEQYEHTAGMYKCRIYHPHDFLDITTEVKLVLLDPVVPVPIAASAGFDMWIIGLIIGILFLIVVIAIIIFVICRKQQEGDYNVGKKETGAGLDPEKELRDKGFNDLSRPDYDDYEYPDKTPAVDMEYDDVPMMGDDESLGEYEDENDMHFNEDGSFIGIYQKRENANLINHSAESAI